MGDLPSLALAVETIGKVSPAPHPFARASQPPAITPMQYLLYAEPDPPHGIPDAAIVEILPAVAKRVAELMSDDPLDPMRVTNRMLTAGVDAGIVRTFRRDGQHELRSARWRDVGPFASGGRAHRNLHSDA